jgi:hypothetical protein
MDVDRSFAAIVRDVLLDVSEIVRSEARLAKAEIAQQARHAASSAVWLAAAAVLAMLAAISLLWSAVYALALVMAMWAAALLVGTILSLVSITIATMERSRRFRFEFLDQIAAAFVSLGAAKVTGYISELVPEFEQHLNAVKENSR